jgi:hypothetical protein
MAWLYCGALRGGVVAEIIVLIVLFGVFSYRPLGQGVISMQ